MSYFAAAKPALDRKPHVARAAPPAMIDRRENRAAISFSEAVGCVSLPCLFLDALSPRRKPNLHGRANSPDANGAVKTCFAFGGAFGSPGARPPARHVHDAVRWLAFRVPLTSTGGSGIIVSDGAKVRKLYGKEGKKRPGQETGARDKATGTAGRGLQGRFRVRNRRRQHAPNRNQGEGQYRHDQLPL